MKSGEEIRYSPILTNIYKKELQKLAFAVKNNITSCKLLNFIHLQISDNIGDLVPPVAVFWYR